VAQYFKSQKPFQTLFAACDRQAGKRVKKEILVCFLALFTVYGREGRSSEAMTG
jgi:hypothetical protein